MYFLPQANTSIALEFLLVLNTDHITGATGKTPTVTISKNGGAFASPQGAVSEIGNGRYMLAPNAADTDTVGPLSLHATATGCDPEDRDLYVVQNLNAINAALTPSSTSMLTLTGRTLVTNALRLLGVIQPNEVPTADDMTTGLYALNELIDGWGAQRLTIPVVAHTSYALTTGVQTYTIGPSGTWNQAWPNSIEGAQVVWTSAGLVYRIPVQIVTNAGWELIGQQGLRAPWPWVVYYSRTFPLGTVKVWPIPDGTQTVSLELNTPTAVAPFATLDTTYAFQPAYAKALRFNLAVAMAPEYPGRPIDPLILQGAAESLGNLKGTNVTPSDLDTSGVSGLFGARRGTYSIYTDGPL
jgi:hypothetical protein